MEMPTGILVEGKKVDGEKNHKTFHRRSNHQCDSRKLNSVKFYVNLGRCWLCLIFTVAVYVRDFNFL